MPYKHFLAEILRLRENSSLLFKPRGYRLPYFIKFRTFKKLDGAQSDEIVTIELKSNRDSLLES